MEERNKYQSEVFQEVEDHPQPVNACIQGSVPSWINGTFLQVGPGRYTWNNTSYNHWFEGDALLFRFHVASGRVEFSSKFIATCSYRAAERHNRISVPRFATDVLPDPCKNIFSRYMSYYFAGKSHDDEDDNCNVSVVKIKNSIYASADIPLLWEIDERTLENISPIKIMNSLPGLSLVSFQTLRSIHTNHLFVNFEIILELLNRAPWRFVYFYEKCPWNQKQPGLFMRLRTMALFQKNLLSETSKKTELRD